MGRGRFSGLGADDHQLICVHRLRYFSLNLFSANYIDLRPLTVARKTLIWHSDFQFLRTFGTQKTFLFFCAISVGLGGGGYAPIPKFLNPPLYIVH